MLKKVYSNVINKFSVRIIYKHSTLESSNIGSGVLVKINNNTYYLITAKHNFKLKKDKKYYNVNIDVLKNNLSNISISNDNEVKVCSINQLVYHDDRYDLLIFSIKELSKNTKKLPISTINKTHNPNKQSYYFYGFPDSKGTPSGELKHEGYENREEDKHIFRLEKDKSIDGTELGGFSGSGIFTKDKDNEYNLIGIFTEFGDDHNFYYGIDLDFVLDKSPIFNDFNINQSQYVIYKDGYIEPITVYIEELNIHVAVCPVTIEEYIFFCKSTNNKIPNGNNIKKIKKPIVNINWNKAQEYCQWLTSKTNKHYKLPISKKWESVALQNIPNNNLQNYIVSRDDFKKNPKLVNVGTKKSGNLNLFDMPGNIYEWSNEKIIKGSSFNTSLKNLNICKNESFDSSYSNMNLGFRVVL